MKENLEIEKELAKLELKYDEIYPAISAIGDA